MIGLDDHGERGTYLENNDAVILLSEIERDCRAHVQMFSRETNKDPLWSASLRANIHYTACRVASVKWLAEDSLCMSAQSNCWVPTLMTVIPGSKVMRASPVEINPLLTYLHVAMWSQQLYGYGCTIVVRRWRIHSMSKEMMEQVKVNEVYDGRIRI